MPAPESSAQVPAPSPERWLQRQRNHRRSEVFVLVYLSCFVSEVLCFRSSVVSEVLLFRLCCVLFFFFMCVFFWGEGAGSLGRACGGNKPNQGVFPPPLNYSFLEKLGYVIVQVTLPPTIMESEDRMALEDYFPFGEAPCPLPLLH